MQKSAFSDCHVPDGDFRWRLHHRSPRFDDVAQFVQFVRMVYDGWRTPSVPSSFARHLERARLGTYIDRSIPPVVAFEPSQVYHVGLIRSVFFAVRRRVEEPRLEDERHRRWESWGRCDVDGKTQATVATYYGVAQQTVGRWVRRVRDELAAELAGRNMMDFGHLGRAKDE